jgi:hypothetical protein
VARGFGIGLPEGLADRGGDHGVPAVGQVSQRVPDPMPAAPLPGRAEHAGNGVAQAVMGIRDHQLDAAQPALDQALEEARPEGSASEGPMPRPTISRRPWVFTATAIIVATETMRPPARPLREVALREWH